MATSIPSSISSSSNMNSSGNKNASSSISFYSPRFYATCSIGGLLSCGLTHTLITPIDLVKCRKQVNPSIYSSLFNGLSTISRANGLKGLWEGWFPTAIGYSLQGACKFGFYEFFKKTYADLAGEEAAYTHRTALFLAASASAEAIADVALCPMEALKVRMQTSMNPNGLVSNAGEEFGKIMRQEGIRGFFKGLGPLWARQVPYTMMKFAAFERTVEEIYSRILSRPKAEYNKVQQLGVTFAAGYWAGIFCAIVSHPADTIVSKMNNKSHSGSNVSFGGILKELGFGGIWRGLGTRIFMVGTLTALQWFIYDSFKVNVGLPTSGATTTNKKHE